MSELRANGGKNLTEGGGEVITCGENLCNILKVYKNALGNY